MQDFKIGIITDNLLISPYEALKEAAAMGIDGVQLYAKDQMAPENLSVSDRKKYRDTVKGYGLEISALCCSLSRAFKQSPPDESYIKATLDTIDLAYDLGTNIVTTHIGKIPADKTSAQYSERLEALTRVGEHALSHGVTIACETGTDQPKAMAELIDKLPKNSFAINFDPANLVMLLNLDPVKAVYELKDYIVHTHVKDGVYVDGSEICEKLPGQGDVNFKSYLAALKSIGYRGYLTVEREAGDDRNSDVLQAVNYIKSMIK